MRRAQELRSLGGLLGQGAEAVTGLMDRRDADAQADLETKFRADPTGTTKAQGTPGFFNTVRAEQKAFDQLTGRRNVQLYTDKLEKYAAENQHLDPDEFATGLAQIAEDFVGGEKTEDYLSEFAPGAAKAESLLMKRYRAKLHDNLKQSAKHAAGLSIAGESFKFYSGLIDANVTAANVSDTKILKKIAEAEPSTADMKGFAGNLEKEHKALVATGMTTQEASAVLIQDVGLTAIRTRQPKLLDVFDVPNPEDNGLKRSDLPQFGATIEGYRQRAQAAQDKLEDDSEAEDKEVTAKAVKAGRSELVNSYQTLKQQMQDLYGTYTPSELRTRFGGEIAALRKSYDDLRNTYGGDIDESFIDRFDAKLDTLTSATNALDTSGDQEVREALARAIATGDTKYFDAEGFTRFMDEDFDRVSQPVRDAFLKHRAHLLGLEGEALDERQAQNLKGIKASIAYYKTLAYPRGEPGTSDFLAGLEPEVLDPEVQAARNVLGSLHRALFELESADSLVGSTDKMYAAEVSKLKEGDKKATFLNSLLEEGGSPEAVGRVQAFQNSDLLLQLKASGKFTSLATSDQSLLARNISNLPISEPQRIQLMKSLNLPVEEATALVSEYTKQSAFKAEKQRALEQVPDEERRGFYDSLFGIAHPTDLGYQGRNYLLGDISETLPPEKGRIEQIAEEQDFDATIQSTIQETEFDRVIRQLEEAAKTDPAVIRAGKNAALDTMLKRRGVPADLIKSNANLRQASQAMQDLDLGHLHAQVRQASEAMQELNKSNTRVFTERLKKSEAEIKRASEALKSLEESKKRVNLEDLNKRTDDFLEIIRMHEDLEKANEAIRALDASGFYDTPKSEPDFQSVLDINLEE